MFKGSIVAIITPFLNGAVDEEKLRELVEFQIVNGTDAIVPCSTTGESSTLDYEEHDRVIEIVVQQVGKRVPVIAGTGSNSTREAIDMTAHAKKLEWGKRYDYTVRTVAVVDGETVESNQSNEVMAGLTQPEE